VRLRVLALAPVVVLAAGCGGSTTYSLEKTRDCLEQKHMQIVPTPAEDFVPHQAGGGTFRVRFPGNLVTLAFGDDRDDAQQVVRGYQAFSGKNIGLTDVLSAKHNAVILWGVHPKEEHVATIEGCLK
jgi:hypothetical protein